MLTITESAQQHILKVLETESQAYLRVSVRGGGCSGLGYKFSFDQEVATDDTLTLVSETQGILVDAQSATYLQGSTIDYQTSLMSSQLVIHNPNVTTSCGCGSSFSVA